MPRSGMALALSRKGSDRKACYFFAECGGRKEGTPAVGWCSFLSYRNTIDFRTPDLKITVRETTLQSSLWLFCIISRFKLQNPVILCQHLHLADGNGVEFCQPL